MVAVMINILLDLSSDVIGMNLVSIFFHSRLNNFIVELQNTSFVVSCHLHGDYVRKL